MSVFSVSMTWMVWQLSTSFPSSLYLILLEMSWAFASKYLARLTLTRSHWHSGQMMSALNSVQYAYYWSLFISLKFKVGSYSHLNWNFLTHHRMVFLSHRSSTVFFETVWHYLLKLSWDCLDYQLRSVCVYSKRQATSHRPDLLLWLWWQIYFSLAYSPKSDWSLGVPFSTTLEFYQDQPLHFPTDFSPEL